MSSALVAEATEHETPVTEEGHAAPADGEHAAGELTATTEAHGGEEHAAFPPFDPSTFGPQLVWLALTFAVLYVLMSRVALPRIGSILEQRQTRIDSDLAAADQARRQTDEAIASYEAALASARSRAQQIAEETRAGMRAEMDQKRMSVEQDLSARMAEAEARIQTTKQAALANVSAIAAETAQALVAQLTDPVTESQARDAVAQVSRG